MSVPEFTAEASLYQTSQQYREISAFQNTLGDRKMLLQPAFRLEECLSICYLPDRQCVDGCYLLDAIHTTSQFMQ